MHRACVHVYSVDGVCLHVCVGTLIFKDMFQMPGSHSQIVSFPFKYIPEQPASHK